MGTPEYMAPEQAAGRATDARSDIYAVGAILYEMLVGRAPFEGQSVIEVLSKKATETPASARSLRPDLPEGLERVIMRTLEHDPDARPQSMTQLEEELVRSVDGRAAARSGPAARDSGTGRPVEDVLFELAVEGSSELAMAGSPPALPPPPSPPPRLTSTDPAPVVIVDRTDVPGALPPAPAPSDDAASMAPAAAGGDALRARDV